MSRHSCYFLALNNSTNTANISQIGKKKNRNYHLQSFQKLVHISPRWFKLVNFYLLQICIELYYVNIATILVLERNV